MAFRVHATAEWFLFDWQIFFNLCSRKNHFWWRR